MKPGDASDLAKLMAALGVGDARQGGPPMDHVAPLSIRSVGGPFPARGWSLTLGPDGVSRPWVSLTYSESGWSEVFWCCWTTRN